MIEEDSLPDTAEKGERDQATRRPSRPSVSICRGFQQQVGRVTFLAHLDPTCSH